MNAFPINGLHPDGCTNADGDKLKAKLDLENALTCKGQVHNNDEPYLDYALVDDSKHARGYQLVVRAKRSGGSGVDPILCSREQMVGVVFEVSVRDPRKPTKYRIGDVAEIIAKLPRDANDSQQPSSCRPSMMCSSFPRVEVPRIAYLITPADSAESVCMTPPPEDIGVKSHAIIAHLPRLKSSSGSQGDLVQVDREDLSLYSMVVPEAVYDHDASLLDGSFPDRTDKTTGGSKHHWFNLACAKDALAQTELSMVGALSCDAAAIPDEEIPEAVARARLPALHMFTAKYYKGRSATIRGTDISWCWGMRAGAKSLEAAQKGHGDGETVVEAVWNDGGAECVVHSRLWRKNRIVYVPPQVEKSFENLQHPIKEVEFLQRICEEPHSPSTMPPIVQGSCPNTQNGLMSFAHEHSPEDNSKAFSIL